MTATEEEDRDKRHSIGAPPLTKFQRIIYGTAGYTVGSASAVVEGPLVFYYNDTLGVSTQYLAIVNFIVGVATIYTSLLIGGLSDRSKARYRRKPFIFVMMFILAAGYFFRFGAFTTERAAPYYYAITMFCQMCANVGLGVVQGGWAVELASEGADRANFFAICGVLGVIGIFCGLALSALPLIIGGIFLATVTLVSNSMCLWYIEEKVPLAKRTFIPTVTNLKSILWNTQFIIYISAMVWVYFINTVPSVYLFFLTYVMDQNEDQANLTFLLSVGGFVLFGFAAIPITPGFIAKWGKLYVGNSCMKSLFIFGILMFIASYTHPMAVVAVFSCVGFFAAVAGIVFSIMQADCVDYDELLTGMKRGASYGGISGPVNTFITIAGTAIPLALMSAFNFEAPDPDADDMSDERAQDGYSSKGSTAVLRFYCTLFISLTGVLAMLVLKFYKIDNKIHDEILTNIFQRDAAVANAQHDVFSDEFEQPEKARDSIVEDEVPVVSADINLSSVEDPVTGKNVVPAPYITVEQTISKVINNKTIMAPDLESLNEEQSTELRLLGYYFSGVLNLCVESKDIKGILLYGHTRLFFFVAFFVLGAWQSVEALIKEKEFPAYLVIVLTTLYSFVLIWEILYMKGYRLLRKLLSDDKRILQGYIEVVQAHLDSLVPVDENDVDGLRNDLLVKDTLYSTPMSVVIQDSVFAIVVAAITLAGAYLAVNL